MWRWVIFVLIFTSFSNLVYAEQRIALLIGNQAYADEVGPLKNPINDIDRVGAALRQIGFKVERVQNASLGETHRAVNRYIRGLRQSGEDAIGFFYYSGHGGANPDTNINYLIPVDVKDADEEALWDDSIPLQQIINDLSDRASNATHFVVFDACRNELQLKKNGAKALGRRKGFQPERQHPSMLIAYATASGEIASDVGAGGGPYATVLAEELIKPGLEAVAMFRQVQLRVREKTGQSPWLSFPSLPKIYLSAGGTAGGPEPTLPPPSASFTGNVQVNVNVPATVYIGGRRVGEANPGKPVNQTDVPMGRVEVKVEAKGYEPITQMANVKVGQWEQLVFVLEPESPCSDQNIAMQKLRSTPSQLTWAQLRKIVMFNRFTASFYNKSIGKYETINGSFQNFFKMQDEVVADCATGLMWQRSTTGPFSFADAQAYIDKLNQRKFAGYSNWRIPTAEELASLTQHRGIKTTFLVPKLHLDADYFHGNAYYCMSSDRVSDPSVSGTAVFSITWAGPGSFGALDVTQRYPVKAVQTIEY